jgi:hypothetical protein
MNMHCLFIKKVVTFFLFHFIIQIKNIDILTLVLFKLVCGFLLIVMDFLVILFKMKFVITLLH